MPRERLTEEERKRRRRDSTARYAAKNPDKERARRARYRAEKPHKMREFHARYREKNTNKERQRHARYRVENADKQREYRARPEVKEAQRDSDWRRNYNITRGQVVEMFEAQGGCCAMCEKELDFAIGAKRDRAINIDHCHTSGKVRGILCVSCNTSVGRYENLKEQIHEYLEPDELTIERITRLIYDNFHDNNSEPNSQSVSHAIPSATRIEMYRHREDQVSGVGVTQTGRHPVRDPARDAADANPQAHPQRTRARGAARAGSRRIR